MICLTLTCLNLSGQKKQVSSAELDQRIFDYIAQFEYLAMSESQRTGVPASIKLAQGILESRYGDSDLAVKANNHFGIKCKVDWKGERVIANDDTPNDCFRKYDSAGESYIDHSDFLKNHRLHFYDHLFEIDKRDYRAWSRGLQLVGYATTNYYAQSLILLIEKYELYLFDESTKGWTLPKAEIRKLSAKAQKVYSMESHPNTKKPPLVGKNQEIANSKKFVVVSSIPGREPYSAKTQTKQSSAPQAIVEKVYTAHKVKKGDTMESIAEKFQIDLEKLYEQNQMIYGSQPTLGSRIYLDGKAGAAPNLKTVEYDLPTRRDSSPTYGLIIVQNPLLKIALNHALNQMIMESVQRATLGTASVPSELGDQSTP